MKRKRLSHEAPLALLAESRIFNDFDYCLVHLLDQYPEYLQFFKSSLEQGRTVILDNSIFELGIAFNSDIFAKWILDLRPTEYIIPDVLEDSLSTIKNLEDWVEKYLDLPGKKIGVVQGKTYKEIVECYQKVDLYCDKIAISFNYSLYESLFPHISQIVSWSMGRVLLINLLMKEGVINYAKPHHLLGCSSPEEFRFYQAPVYNFIESIDSSNPIVHGLLGIVYPVSGLWTKKQIKLANLIESPVTPSQMFIINKNILRFRQIVDGN